MPLRSVDICDYLLTDPVTIGPDENIFHAIDIIIKPVSYTHLTLPTTD